jgi:hypothetical protein
LPRSLDRQALSGLTERLFWDGNCLV